jgi:CheY-like chemotaxis protein
VDQPSSEKPSGTPQSFHASNPKDIRSKDKHLPWQPALFLERFLRRQATAKNESHQGRPQMYSILLVDDEPQILAAWSLILADEGYSVTCASNGVEALECLKHHVPNLIVTDWIMPLMDGLALCREIRARPDLANIPILGHSAAPPPDVLQPDWNLCLKKPVAVSLFVTIVSNLCKRAI